MRESKPTVVALIPARAGSKRIPHKNIRFLGKHPLMAYAIASAKESGIFDAIILATNSKRYAEIGRHYGAEVPVLRSENISGPLSPDIEWVQFMLNSLADEGRRYDCFSILRPTSPFRLPLTIQRAWDSFISTTGVDSLRAVEKCKQHPGKMWIVQGNWMNPLLPLSIEGVPLHSCQYAALPEVYVQNASLEIAWAQNVEETETISGYRIMPFLSSEIEGFDINDHEDWRRAEEMAAENLSLLPKVSQSKFDMSSN